MCDIMCLGGLLVYPRLYLLSGAYTLGVFLFASKQELLIRHFLVKSGRRMCHFVSLYYTGERPLFLRASCLVRT